MGKSTVSDMLAEQFAAEYVSLDELRSSDFSKRSGEPSPCSVSRLNLKDCVFSVLDRHRDGFVLDFGGDSVFREGTDNDDRVEQVMWLKRSYSAQVVVLTSQQDILRKRFLATKNRTEDEFERIWTSWSLIEEPCWRLCADRIIDTTSLAPVEVMNLLRKA